KDRLFSIIGHDLRGPAAALQHVAELIHYHHEKGNVQQLMELGRKTARAAGGINSMLDNLLNWSLSQTGDLQLQAEPLKVYPLIQEVVELHDEFAFSKHITICHSGLESATVMADKNALLTILRNLLSNAIKFTHPGGAVTIHTQAENDRVKIIFRDNGVGISPEKMKVLFDLHQPKSSRGTAKEKGTGLGMVLVQELLEKIGGEIEVSSQPEEGTTVLLTLPACS
ncbi:MAG: HAMP domain-containing histidine kinase, partial [Pontibacter sp.]|nr:HAMP domain-containing histidine kinase [Pontibacter sp.]